MGGPSHRAAFSGLAAPDAVVWESPLGEVLIDFQALEAVQACRSVIFSDRVHAQEHCLEVQLPFLQVLLDDFKVVPLLTGDVSAEEVAEVLETLWGGPETLVVISSDLSHYLEDSVAKEMDERTAGAIIRLDAEALGEPSACGRIPIAGLLRIARRNGMRAELIDLRNSGDTAGPKDQVVGYGAFAFYD